jgi:hypothetical protein
MADPVAGKSALIKMHIEVRLIHAAARTQDLGDDFAASSVLSWHTPNVRKGRGAYPKRRNDAKVFVMPFQQARIDSVMKIEYILCRLTEFTVGSLPLSLQEPQHSRVAEKE